MSERETLCDLVGLEALELFEEPLFDIFSMSMAYVFDGIMEVEGITEFGVEETGALSVLWVDSERCEEGDLIGFALGLEIGEGLEGDFGGRWGE